VCEGELPEKLAREAFLKAAEGIHKGDGKYSAEDLEERIDDAFRNVGRNDVGGRV
jgi:hypothetical protein